MSYSDFTYPEVLPKLGLREKPGTLFEGVPTLAASPWLRETLGETVEMAKASGSEKAKSEFIVAPILIELKKRNPHQLAVYSGRRMDVAPERGLNGECDFILSHSEILQALQTPIFALVEAKSHNISLGLGQCIAQMVGAKLFNEKDEKPLDTVFGCVTTGDEWQFLRLRDNIVIVDKRTYYLVELEAILGVLQYIVESYTPPALDDEAS